MAKRKKVKVRYRCDGNCAECPNYGTKNCEMFKKRRKKVNKKKKDRK